MLKSSHFQPAQETSTIELITFPVNLVLYTKEEKQRNATFD